MLDTKIEQQLEHVLKETEFSNLGTDIDYIL